MQHSLAALFCALPLIAAATCSGDSAQAKAPAGPQAALDAGAKQGGPCSLFTSAEIKEAFGSPVGPGETAGMGTGCQWPATENDSAFAQIAVNRDTSAWSNPIAAPSYQKVSGITGEGFSVKDPQGGWRAEARNGKGAYVVMMIGSEKAKREGAVALLKKLMERS
jgi:hypothetical protein